MTLSPRVAIIIFCATLLAMIMSCCTETENTPTAPVTPATVGMSIEEIKSGASIVPYDSLMRYESNYVGDIIYNKGEIIQVYERRTDSYILRVATKRSEYGGYYEDIIYVNYKGNRLLEGDIINIWGEFEGLETYETILGGRVTIPGVESLHISRVT